MRYTIGYRATKNTPSFNQDGDQILGIQGYKQSGFNLVKTPENCNKAMLINYYHYDSYVEKGKIYNSDGVGICPFQVSIKEFKRLR